MINTAVRRAAVLLATLGIPAMLLAAPLPASAATSGSLCETNGLWCLNTANFSLYTPATESLTNARTIEAESQIAPAGTWELVFKGDTSDCLGATNDGIKVEIKPCNGGSDIFWIEQTSGGSAYWENTGATSTIGTKMYLSGNGSTGSPYVLAAKGKNGTYQLFEFR
jgi:hypothetical protein